MLLTENQKNFIGYKFTNIKGNVVEVIGIDPNNKSNYLCTCSYCSKDRELFPEPFSVTKSQITKMGQTPCGCSLTPKYCESQWEVLVKRECLSREYNVKFDGWCGEFKFSRTKLLLTNLDNGVQWTPTIQKFCNKRSDDPKTALLKRSSKRRTPMQVIERKLKGILEKGGCKFLNFVGEYRNSLSKFRWVCDRGHLCETEISNFIHSGRRCRECNKGGYITGKTGNLYIVRWYNDYKSYLKIGITNSEVNHRLKAQKSKTPMNYEVVRTFVHPDGSVVSECEKYIKNTLQCGVCPKELLPDGFTETLEDSYENLRYMEDYLSFYLF